MSLAAHIIDDTSREYAHTVWQATGHIAVPAISTKSADKALCDLARKALATFYHHFDGEPDQPQYAMSMIAIMLEEAEISKKRMMALTKETHPHGRGSLEQNQKVACLFYSALEQEKETYKNGTWDITDHPFFTSDEINSHSRGVRHHGNR